MTSRPERREAAVGSEGARGLSLGAEDERPRSGPRRTSRAVRRRSQLFAVALELFVGRGYGATTMDDIAEAAGVARATVFNHFPRKAAFLEEWMWQRRERARRVMKSHGEATSVVSTLRDFTITLAQVAIETPEETRALIEAPVQETGFLHGSALAQDLGSYIRDGQLAGEIKTDFEPQRVGRLMATGFAVTLAEWVREPHHVDLHEQVQAYLDLMLYGMTESVGDARKLNTFDGEK